MPKHDENSSRKGCGGCLARLFGFALIAGLIAVLRKFLAPSAKAPTAEEDRILLPQEAATMPPAETTAADDLTRISGIGPSYQKKLQDAGIRSFAQLAAASDAELERILQPQSFQKLDYAGWREQAQELAQQPSPVTGDDLTQIQGVGAVFARRLKEAGINTFAQLAAQTPAQLEAICQAPAWRKPDYQSWIYQAQQRSQPSA